MNQKQLRERLRAARIFNEHGIARLAQGLGLSGVYLKYRPQETGRAYQSAAWQVVHVGFQTDPGGYWRDHGHKTFDVRGREQKDEQRAAAIGWASERYGYDPEQWKPGPWGRAAGWFPGPELDAVLEAVENGARLTGPRDDIVTYEPADEGR